MEFKDALKVVRDLSLIALVAFAFLFGVPTAEQTPEFPATEISGSPSGKFPVQEFSFVNVTNNSEYSNFTQDLQGCLRVVRINGTFANRHPQNVSVEVQDEDGAIVFIQNVTNGSIGENQSVNKFFARETALINIRNMSFGSNASDNENGSLVLVNLLWEPGTYC